MRLLTRSSLCGAGLTATLPSALLPFCRSNHPHRRSGLRDPFRRLDRASLRSYTVCDAHRDPPQLPPIQLNGISPSPIDFVPCSLRFRARPPGKVRRRSLHRRDQEIVSPVYFSLGSHAATKFSSSYRSAATLKQVEQDLTGVRAAIKGQPQIQDFLANPVLSSKDRAAGIDELLKAASPKAAVSEVTKTFFEVLADNGRLYDAEKVIDDFLEIMSAHRGEVKVTITTAQPLEKDLQKRLEDSLKQSALAGQGKTLIIQNKVNEAVLGGLIVDFGDKTVDLSVASRVNKLNATLQGIIFRLLLSLHFTHTAPQNPSNSIGRRARKRKEERYRKCDFLM